MKTCNQCKQTKPYSDFHKAPAGKGGVQGCCKVCRKALDAKRYAEDPKWFSARFKAWYEKNKERDAEMHRRWLQENKERANETHRAWQRANPEKVREIEKTKRTRHADRIAAYMKAYGPKWVKANPEKHRDKARRYRARKLQAPISDLTAAQWALLKEMYNLSCAYCGERVEVLTQDHVLALSKGGSHTASNVVPACKSCNSSKHDKPVDEFLKSLEV